MEPPRALVFVGEWTRPLSQMVTSQDGRGLPNPLQTGDESSAGLEL